MKDILFISRKLFHDIGVDSQQLSATAYSDQIGDVNSNWNQFKWSTEIACTVYNLSMGRFKYTTIKDIVYILAIEAKSPLICLRQQTLPWGQQPQKLFP